MAALFDAISLHAYWSSAGLTRWNSTRWRLFPRPAVPILVTECGRDRVRDGPNGTYLPPGDGPAFGWRAQGLTAEQFLAELAAYDAQLRADGVYAVVFTTSPDDEWTAKGFSVDDLAAACHGFTNLGPHDLEGRSPEALAWAAVAPIVKSVDQTAAIRRAGPGAITVYRRRFSPAEQDAMLDLVDAGHVDEAAQLLVGAIVNGLAGFRHPDLHVELLNEVGKGRRAAYLRLAAAAVPLLRAAGLRVAGPSWATGDYEADDWAAFAGAPAPPAPTPTPTPAPRPTTGGARMPDWYPGATRRLITTNYTPGRGGRAPVAIVDHIADGLGSPFTWFNTDRGELGSSAHFWVSRAGKVEQYRPLSDTCWANGPIASPDLANPTIASIVAEGVNPNRVTVAIEHEGRPGDLLPAAQVAASRALHRWLAAALGIPLDHAHVLGHYQFDDVTRANCPGLSFPWAQILAKEAPMPDPIPPAPSAALADLQAETYAHAHALRTLKARWQAAGYPQAAEGIEGAGAAAERIVSLTKGER